MDLIIMVIMWMIGFLYTLQLISILTDLWIVPYKFKSKRHFLKSLIPLQPIYKGIYQNYKNLPNK